MNLCQTCGRRASERMSYLQVSLESHAEIRCNDPLHDAADRVGEIVEALLNARSMLRAYGSPSDESHALLMNRIDAALPEVPR